MLQYCSVLNATYRANKKLSCRIIQCKYNGASLLIFDIILIHVRKILYSISKMICP